MLIGLLAMSGKLFEKCILKRVQRHIEGKEKSFLMQVTLNSMQIAARC
jgi:hypothetical protein